MRPIWNKQIRHLSEHANCDAFSSMACLFLDILLLFSLKMLNRRKIFTPSYMLDLYLFLSKALTFHFGSSNVPTLSEFFKTSRKHFLGFCWWPFIIQDLFRYPVLLNSYDKTSPSLWRWMDVSILIALERTSEFGVCFKVLIHRVLWRERWWKRPSVYISIQFPQK